MGEYTLFGVNQGLYTPRGVVIHSEGRSLAEGLCQNALLACGSISGISGARITGSYREKGRTCNLNQAYMTFCR